MKLIVASILSLAATAFAELRINNPIQSTTWTNGDTVDITWVDEAGAPLTGTVTVQLMSGDNNNLDLISTIASGVDAATGKVSFAVPNTLPANSNYVVRVTSSVSGPHYSHGFQAGDGEASVETTEDSASDSATDSTDTDSTDTESTDTESKDTESKDTESTDTESTDTESKDTESTDTESTEESTEESAEESTEDDSSESEESELSEDSEDSEEDSEEESSEEESSEEESSEEDESSSEEDEDEDGGSNIRASIAAGALGIAALAALF